ncbi:UDP-N-acetylmuramyl pentapeptide phosphotransferase/UDP-N-acetylglucosamine-1-phosphate transferase [Salinibacter ruber]|uniref:MraY family glycosyltransferase n=1 Tax=Salinibacter ruber TaxID=146919 RepID=UPI00216A4DE7|nr:MraY family glycosyltransferase [Salinibacter ruber]MCS3630773.1 UDP-N-acetylmuramyl pentapeptide phosphotransferase/UDP-N-acetylglucosamine-1-phosphate transferase [Salinibacter ruber]
MATPLFLRLVGSVVAGFLVTVLLTGLVCEQAPRLGLLDRPTQARKVHRRVTPTGGGIAIAAGLAVGLGVLWGFWGSFPGAVQSLSFWVGAAIMLATGYWDDKHALDAKAKFAFQLVAAYLLLHSGTILPLSGGHADALSPDVVAGALPFSEALYIIPLSMLWIVGIINAVNLIDGLATGIIGIAFLACAALFGVKGEIALTAVGIVMAGALVGFLPHNFKPATIFMGDSGSLLLGYLLAGYTLQGPSTPTRSLPSSSCPFFWACRFWTPERPLSGALLRPAPSSRPIVATCTTAWSTAAPSRAPCSPSTGSGPGSGVRPY